MEMPKEYITVDGPDGLTRVLNELLEKSKKDPIFREAEHYVLYELGQQRSMIKIDTTNMPFRFWHYDLMGRPATSALRDTVAKFLWENCGQEEQS